MIQIKSILILVILLGISCLYAEAQDLKTAIYKTKSQQYDEAEAMFKQLIKNEPNNGRYYFYYGENFIKAYVADTFSISIDEMVNQAKPLFNKGIKMDSTNSFNYIGLGHLAFLQNETSQASQYFNKAETLLPKYNLKKIKKIKEPRKIAMVLSRIAEAQIGFNHVDTSKVLPLLREAELIDPSNPEIYIIEGDVYLTINDGTNSIRNYSKAQELDKTSPDAIIKKGNIYLRSGNLQAALPYFEEAITIDSSFAPAYRELGELYYKAGQYEKAKKFYTKYLNLSGDNIPAKVEYIKSLYNSKGYDEAAIQIEEVLKIDTSRLFLKRLAAYCYFDKKDADFKKAHFYIEEFLRSSKPERIMTKDFTYYGNILLKKNQDFLKPISDTVRLGDELKNYSIQYKKEKKTKIRFQLKSKIDSIQQELLLANKRIMEDSIEINKGFEKLIIAFNRDTTNLSLASDISFDYYIFRRYDDAAKWFLKKIKLSPKPDVNDYMYLGKSYYQGKDFKNAETTFSKLITEIDTSYIQGFYMLANSYAAMDPDSKQGLAKPKYEQLIQKAIVDSVKNEKELYDAYSYLGSYHLFVKVDYNQAKMYFNKMISLDPDNKAGVIKGYASMAMLYSLRKDYILAKESYQKILKMDSDNQNAKKGLEYLKKVKNKEKYRK